MEKLLKDLNEVQRQAVQLADGPMLIVAGAGSGKTRVITYKVAYLIASGVASPSEITAVTFTNKATAEMKQRIEALLSETCSYDELRFLTVSTFHSFCARVLRGHIDRLGISRDFVIYDSEDQKALISKLLDDHNIDKKDITPKAVVALFSSAKNAQTVIRPGSRLEKVYEDYEAELKKANALDFGDLLKFTMKIFSEHKDVLNIYQDRARYLFVDEYQDTNRIQYKIIKMLSSKHRNICVVGDEDQSIYKWRGADIKNILDFEKDFQDARVVKLEQNYRSTANIIGASSSLISKNFQRKDKNLFTKNANGEKVRLASLVNDLSEADYIVDEIRSAVRGNFDYKDIAILYRINAQSRLLEDTLRKSSVPYKIIGGIRFYDRREIKDIVSYLRLTVNSKDNVSLDRIINIPSRGIGKATMDRLYKKVSDNGTSLYETMYIDAELNDLSPAARKKIKDFILLVETFKAMHAANASSTEIMKAVIDRTEYFDFLKEKEGLEADERIDNVMELLSAMASFEETSEVKTITAFLESISLVGDETSDNGDDNGVKLMTLHSAKGLEFPIVFIQGLEYGLLPYIKYGAEELNDIEEERRLFYVGMTRAMKKLYISWARSRRIFGGIKARKPSDFIEEIDEKFLELYDDQENYYEKKIFPGVKAKVNAHTGYRYVVEEPIEEEGICRVGTRVRHSTYGEGIIRAVEGKGEKAKVTVHFRNCGVKKLILGYANLVGC
jgi:DNA helicase-2/ATP-dependent DNA helicase PcrA